MAIYLNPQSRVNTENAWDLQDRLLAKSRPTKVPITALTVTANVGTYGAVIAFTLASSVAGFSSLRLLRSQDTDATTATVVNSWSITSQDGGQDFSYTDSDASLATSNTNYWVQGIPVYDTQLGNSVYVNQLPGLYYGPVNLAELNGNLIPPDPITDFAVSLLAGSNGTQQVCVAYAPTLDPSFGTVRMFIAGYHGNSASVAIAENSYSPFIFTVDQTGEAVTFWAFATNVTGIKATTAPTLSVTFNGAATVPCKLENVTAAVINGGTQIDFDAGAEATVTSFKVYRSAQGAGFGAASLITTIATDGSNHYTYYDPQGLNAFYDYYVTAVNSIGASAPSDVQSTTPSPANLDQLADGTSYFRNPNCGPVILDNSNFEASSVIPPPGWVSQGGTLSYETGTPQSGHQSLKVVGSVWAGVCSIKHFQVLPGDGYKISGYMKSDGTIVGRLLLACFDGNNNYLGGVQVLSGTSTSWNFYSATGTIPAGTAWADIQCGNNNSGTGTVWIDNVGIVRISSLDDEVWDGTTYFKGSNFPSLAGGIDNGNFESSATIMPPPCWAVQAGAPALSYETQTQQSGSRSLKMGGAAGCAVWETKSYKVVPGEIYKLSGYVRAAYGATASLVINFFDVNYSLLASIQASTTSSTWTFVVNYGAVPTNAVLARVYCYMPVTGYSWFDNITVTKLANLDDEVADGNNYKRPLYVSSDGTFHSSTVLKTQGSIIPSQPIVINYSYNSNAISLSWAQTSMLMADGSSFTLYAGAAYYVNLAASTRYNIFPYIRMSDGTIQFTNGSPPPTGTSPQTLLCTEQNMDGRIPTDPLFITTSASGGNGGGGSGGGGDVCPEGSELVDIRGKGPVQAKECPGR